MIIVKHEKKNNNSFFKRLFKDKKEKKLVEDITEEEPSENHTESSEPTESPEISENNTENNTLPDNNTETLQTPSNSGKPQFKIVGQPQQSQQSQEENLEEDTDISVEDYQNIQQENTDEDENDEAFNSEYGNLNERKPYRKAKSFFNSIFRFGQALNAKPDEFSSDEDITNADSTDEKNYQEKHINDTTTEQGEKFNYDDILNDSPYSEQRRIKAPPPIEDIDMSFATVKKVNGNIFIENNIAPMYTIETTKSSFSVEIGKLYPIIFHAYEEYLDPTILKAKREAEKARKQTEVPDEEIITKATTVFGTFRNDKEKEKKTTKEANKKVFEKKDYSKITPEEDEEEDEKIAEKYRLSFLSRREKKKLQKKSGKQKSPKTKKSKDSSFTYSMTRDLNLLASSTSKQEYEKIDDYEVPQDARAVLSEINMNIKRLFFRMLIVGGLFLFNFILVFLQWNFSEEFINLIPDAGMVYCSANLLLLLVGIGVSFESIKKGLAPLIYFKGSSDTAISVACVVCLIQCIVALFNVDIFYNGQQNLYALLVLFALTVNSVGKLIMVLRIKDNFRFVLHDRKKYAATIFNNTKIAEKMVRGTNSADPIIAYQRKTDFYKNFLKLSYAKDPCEIWSAKFSIWTILIAVITAIIHGIIYQSITGAISSLAMVTSLTVHVACMLSVNIPMKKLCRNALLNDAMIVGYPAVKQFADTSAIMLDSKELYPSSCVRLKALKPFVNNEILEETLLNVAAVLKFTNTSLTYVFSELINNKVDELPFVDSVKFEENKGIVAWIGGERILIGRRSLMEKYGITGMEETKTVPFLQKEKDLADQHTTIIYIASAGQLTAWIEASYSPDVKIKAELLRLQENGVSILIRTVDPVIRAEMIAEDYGLHKNSLKLFPNSLGHICKQSISEKSTRARSYICTRGKFSSLAGAISGCIKIKSNITRAVILEFAVILFGLATSVGISLFSAEQSIGTIIWLLLMIFWTASSIIAPLI